VAMTTFFSVQTDSSALSDLRAWSEKHLIAAAKTGRRAPFGELCKRHVKKVFRLRERREILNTAILGLRPRARKAVELHQLQEHSLRETAPILGISTAAVKVRMFQARVTLHRMPLLQSAGRSVRANAR
jgi:RNA polymerase sigma factor (sigma-70 family)